MSRNFTQTTLCQRFGVSKAALDKHAHMSDVNVHQFIIHVIHTSTMPHSLRSIHSIMHIYYIYCISCKKYIANIRYVNSIYHINHFISPSYPACSCARCNYLFNWFNNLLCSISDMARSPGSDTTEVLPLLDLPWPLWCAANAWALHAASFYPGHPGRVKSISMNECMTRYKHIIIN